MTFVDPYNSHIREIGKEAERERERIRMCLINTYLTINQIIKQMRLKEYLGSDHGYLKANGIDMNIINHYRTPNLELLNDRSEKYLKHRYGSGRKNYDVNKITFFKDIPDGVEILIDYVDATTLRTMNIPSEIIYESIYRELPELFEE